VKWIKQSASNGGVCHADPHLQNAAGERRVSTLRESPRNTLNHVEIHVNAVEFEMLFCLGAAGTLGGLTPTARRIAITPQSSQRFPLATPPR